MQLELSLQILDQHVSLRTRSAHFYGVVSELYRRFCVTSFSGAGRRRTFILPQECGSGLDGSSAESDSPLDVTRFVISYTANVRSHLLFHAAVLADADGAILIVAPSMHGKTTLTLELLRRGFAFLSDEMAALSLKTGWVEPFPRALAIRTGSLKRAGFPSPPPETPTWLGKQIVDAEKLRPGCFGDAASIRHIFFLHDDAEKGEEQQSEIPSCGLLLSSLPPDLCAAIKRINALESVRIGQLDEQPYLTIYTHDRSGVLRQIDDLCRQFDTELIHLGYRPLLRPDFAGPVSLNAITCNEAVLCMLQQFLGGYQSALLKEEMGNSPARLALDLARMLQNANCYRLRVGPLQQTADTICAALD